MKKKFLIFIICLLLLLFLLLYPQEALRASRDGLKLWLETLLPTLLPFMILTKLLLHTEYIIKIVQPIAPFFKVVFHLSPYGTYAFLLGLLCGYPMGVKLVADLYYSGKISRQEANYLLTFCNNPSPVFLITYVGNLCLGKSISILYLGLILFVSDLICMCFFQGYYRHKGLYVQEDSFLAKKEFQKSEDFKFTDGRKEEMSWGNIIDDSIMNGFETMTKLGGYIVIFSILSACISHFWKFSPLGKYIFLGMLELTTGIHNLAISGLAYSMRTLMAMCFCAFGGLCIMAQTKSVLGKDLSLRPYACAKCMNTVLTAIFTLIFL